jgi:hypothetical protein
MFLVPVNQPGPMRLMWKSGRLAIHWVEQWRARDFNPAYCRPYQQLRLKQPIKRFAAAAFIRNHERAEYVANLRTPDLKALLGDAEYGSAAAVELLARGEAAEALGVPVAARDHEGEAPGER